MWSSYQNCGWHPHVDLEDIKLKIVQNLGEDMHDYNLWQSRERELVRKPYITDQPLTDAVQQPADVAVAIENVLGGILRMKNVQVRALPSTAGEDSIELGVADNRHDALSAYKNNPDFTEMI